MASVDGRAVATASSAPSPSLTRFLNHSSPITVLPTTTSPRLLLTGSGPLQRWRRSSLYPAFRVPAKVLRLALRSAAAVGVPPPTPIRPQRSELHDFVAGALPDTHAGALLIGTEGPAQKYVVQLWSGDAVVAYLKYAEKPASLERLDHELQMLTALPPGLGPRVYRAGPLFEGRALLLEALSGRRLAPTPRPQRRLTALLEQLPHEGEFDVAEHPWITALGVAAKLKLEPVISTLSDRAWSTTLQHGDLTPWNVIQGSDGALRLLDWEYGSTHGFPYLDAAHYLLQVGLLVKRLHPARASERALAFLSEAFRLRPATAEALVKLAAFKAFHDNQRDGVPNTAPLQSARQMIFGGP